MPYDPGMALIPVQVIVKPADPSAAQELMAEFSRADSDVGALIANNFSIAAPARNWMYRPRVELTFRTPLWRIACSGFSTRERVEVIVSQNLRSLRSVLVSGS